MTKNIDLTSQLKRYFGFDKFKGDQEAIIRNLLAGNDTFVLMPTGGGKSLCYQLPSLLMDGVKLEVEPEAYDYIVDKAVEFKLGARGLRSIVESIMLDVMYEVPSAKKDKFVLTKDFAEKQMAKAKSLKA